MASAQEIPWSHYSAGESKDFQKKADVAQLVEQLIRNQ